jgi:hypothetical protein
MLIWLALHLVPTEVDKLHDGNQTLPTQDREPQTCCHVKNPHNLLPCKLQSSYLEDMPTIIDSDSGPGRQDLVQGKNAGLQEQVSINLDGDPEESYDITLACFLRKKLKRR